MILYHVVTTYHLLNALVHKFRYHKDDDCVLIISHWLQEKFPDYMSLESCFKDVIVIVDSINIKNMTYPENNTEYCQAVLKKYSYNITDFDEIHMFAPHYKFGVYATHLGIPYIYWEEAAGMLSRKSELLDIERRLNTDDKPEYCDLNGLYDGTASCVVKRICNKSVQSKDFDDTNTEHFDIVEEYSQLPIDEQKTIKAFFTDVEEIDIPSDSILLLTQHFTNLKIFSFEDHALIYQLVADYFFNGEKIVFKPHPDDIMYYSLLFPESRIIREKFPSEFLPVMFTNKPKTIATISSTAIYNLQNHFDNSFCLGVRFEKDFKALHRYYTALTLYKQLGVKCPIVGIGDNEPVVNELCKAENISVGNGKGRFYIVDDIETNEKYDRKAIINLTESLDTDSAVVFINFRQDFCFYDINHKQLWNNIVPICIQKKQLSDDEFYADTSTEVVYFYSNNEELRKMAQELNFTRVLDHTGMEISIEKLTPEQKQIKVLEGILEATEKRLLYYMNLVEEKKG